ncbi:MAG: RNA polymerase sigma factor [Ignavibacteriaceae bacterium]
MKNISDLEIIESVKKGNRADYSILVDRYKNKAFSLIVRMVKNQMDAEEVLQDCFVKAYNSLESFKQQAKFSTWFYRIVYNTALTRLSTKKRKVENDMSSIDELYFLESNYNPETTEQKDSSQFMQSMIEKLPPSYSAVINMFYLDNMSCEEISEIMQTSVSNVKVMLHRSRNLLRDILIKNNYAEEIL